MIEKISSTNSRKWIKSEYRKLVNKIIKKYLYIKFRNDNKYAIKDCIDEYFSSVANIDEINFSPKKDKAFIKLVENALNNLSKRDRQLIEDFFINRKKLSESYYSKPWVNQLLNRASKNFCELILW